MAQAGLYGSSAAATSQLANSGPGDVLALFVCSSLVASLAAYAWHYYRYSPAAQ